VPWFLPSNGLLSKWGFSDGDIFDEYLWDRADAEGIASADVDNHRALITAVRTVLLPALNQDVEVYEIGTIHNPIRAALVDGVTIDDYYGTPGVELTPDGVWVSGDDLWRWATTPTEALENQP